MVHAREIRRRERVRADLPRRFAEYRRTGDRRLRNELVEAHYGLAVRLAQEFAGRGERLDDLVQVALLGLVKAVERFDPDRGVAFTTFAVHTARGEIKRHFRDHFWTVHVARGAKNLSLRVTSVGAELAQQLGRVPRAGELAEQLGVTEDEVLEAIDARNAVHCESLDLTADDGSSPAGAPDPGFDEVELRSVVESMLAALPERERRVVELRFVGGLKQREIGHIIGVSQMHVSRILAHALAELRAETERREHAV